MSLHPGELSTLRGAYLDVFTSTATVMRKTTVADTQGGQRDTYVSAGTYPCHFAKSQIRPREVEFTVRIQDVTYWAFHFPSGTNVLPTDRLVTGGRTFEVVGHGEGSRGLLLELIAQEIY